MNTENLTKTSSKRKKLINRIIIASVILFILLISFTTYLTLWYPYHSAKTTSRIINIPHNANLKEIANILYEKDVIYSKTLFTIAAQVLGWSGKLYAGSYLFENNLSNYDILLRLTNHEQQIIQKITIREGLTARQIAGLLRSRINIDSSRFMKLVNDPKFISNKCGLPLKSLEGFIFPNTYNFYWEPDEEDILTSITKEFKRFYHDSLQKRMKEQDISMLDMGILASIVEGEARLDSERPIIAGVYLNRIKKNMKLEADPTIQYVLPNGPRRLFYSDYKYPSTYNTYLHPGLPPGPINNPGAKSFLAVLYPEKHNYLYFVAKGDGSHYFSETYKGHLTAKSKRKR
jgi:UPF0755 protein